MELDEFACQIEILCDLWFGKVKKPAVSHKPKEREQERALLKYREEPDHILLRREQPFPLSLNDATDEQQDAMEDRKEEL